MRGGCRHDQTLTMRTLLTRRYKLEISELQRRLIMRALTSTVANNNRRQASTDALDDARRAEWMTLVRLFAQLDEERPM
jgi:hypothetical protein